MKRGPKPQPEAHRATKVLRARVTAQELAIAKQLASDEDMKLSDLIRDAISAYQPKRL